jgi:two-component system, OmpR family, sensor histidine kinase KdpD
MNDVKNNAAPIYEGVTTISPVPNGLTYYTQHTGIKNDAEMEKMRFALISSIAHDLKSPLSVIITSLSALSLLENKLDVKAKHDLMQAAQTEAERLNNFISNMLELSSLETTDTLRIDGVNPNEMIQSFISSSPASSRIHYVKSDTDCLIYMDASLMERVLKHLIDNCIKFTPSGSLITIKTQLVEGRAVFTIADQGKGIDAANRSMVFEKFYQQHKGKKGTGLGLSICKAIIEKHGGTISVNANPAQTDADYPGCVFTLSLPNLARPPDTSS